MERQNVEIRDSGQAGLDDSVLLRLKRLCSQNKGLISKLVISGEAYEQLRWDIHEHNRLYGFIGHEVPQFNPGIKIYGIDIETEND